MGIKLLTATSLSNKVENSASLRNVIFCAAEKDGVVSDPMQSQEGEKGSLWLSVD